jgi:CheY-like chemotaxis protein
MAGTSGIEVILELRNFAPALPIIAVLGENLFGALERLQDAQLLGQVGLLRKPFSNAELLAAVEAQSNRRDQQLHHRHAVA